MRNNVRQRTLDEIIGWLFMALIAVFVAGVMAIYLYSFWELAFARDDLPAHVRFIWALVLLFGNGIGLVAYLVIGRRK